VIGLQSCIIGSAQAFTLLNTDNLQPERALIANLHKTNAIDREIQAKACMLCNQPAQCAIQSCWINLPAKLKYPTIIVDESLASKVSGEMPEQFLLRRCRRGASLFLRHMDESGSRPPTSFGYLRQFPKCC
jgi:hypothetical protein